jgi:3-oxoacyl-[acyl-carrier protein] reductase
MALGLGEFGISVNTLSLGGVMTESYTNKMEQKAQANGVNFETQMQSETNNIPLRKYASVQDVVDAVSALLGPLSNHMTGQNILLDGGFFKGY